MKGRLTKMNVHEVNAKLAELTGLLNECQRRVADLYRNINGEVPADLLQKPAVWLIEQIENREHDLRCGHYKNAFKRVAETFEEKQKRVMTVRDLAGTPIEDLLRFKNLGRKALDALAIVLAKYGLELRR